MISTGEWQAEDKKKSKSRKWKILSGRVFPEGGGRRRSADQCYDKWRHMVKCKNNLAMQKLYVASWTLFLGALTELENPSVSVEVPQIVFNTLEEYLRRTGSNVNVSESRWILRQKVPEIVPSLKKRLQEKSIKTKVGAFSVLKELVKVLPGCLEENHIEYLIPEIEKALLDDSSTPDLKIEALTFTGLVLSSHAPSVFCPHIKAISKLFISAVSGRGYTAEVTAETLRVCGELVCVMRPNGKGPVCTSKPVLAICNAIMTHLKAKDEEVKECAITCTGLFVSAFGDDFLSEKLNPFLYELLSHMRNERTRLTAVKAFAVIAGSPLHLDLSEVLPFVLTELTRSLKKPNQALRQATLETLNTLFVGQGYNIDSDDYDDIKLIEELSSLISDSDPRMAELALELCCTLMSHMRSRFTVGDKVLDKVLPQALTLVRSSLLQRQALQVLQNFFAALVDSAYTSFDLLLDSLISTAETSSQAGGVAKQDLLSVAQCVAVLCLAAGDLKCSSTVNMLIDVLKDDSNTNSAKKHLALLCLGEIGRRKDLSSHTQIENIIIDSFQAHFEERKFASYALGNIAVGNLPKYLPFILDKIGNQQEKQDLLLHSLKEVIVRQSVDKAEFQESSVQNILNLLFNHTESEEEGVRNVVAECLGKIALIEPQKLVPALKERTAYPAAFTRATVVIAIKYAIVEKPEKIDGFLHSEISSFLMLMKDQDRDVRHAAVLALSTAAQNKPNMIKGLLHELLPVLFDQTRDKGLDLRIAAFECVDTLLDSCIDQVNASSFIVPYLKSGLDDDNAVKVPCYHILSKLARKCPDAVLSVLDSLVDTLQKNVSSWPKQDADKKEIERNEAMIRSAVHVIASLNAISGVDRVGKFKNLISMRFPTTFGEIIRFAL